MKQENEYKVATTQIISNRIENLVATERIKKKQDFITADWITAHDIANSSTYIDNYTTIY